MTFPIFLYGMCQRSAVFKASTSRKMLKNGDPRAYLSLIHGLIILWWSDFLARFTGGSSRLLLKKITRARTLQRPFEISQMNKKFPWIAGLVGTGLGTFAMLSWDNTTQMAAATSVADIIAKNIEVPMFIAPLPDIDLFLVKFVSSRFLSTGKLSGLC